MAAERGHLPFQFERLLCGVEPPAGDQVRSAALRPWLKYSAMGTGRSLTGRPGQESTLVSDRLSAFLRA